MAGPNEQSAAPSIDNDAITRMHRASQQNAGPTGAPTLGATGDAVVQGGVRLAQLAGLGRILPGDTPQNGILGIGDAQGFLEQNSTKGLLGGKRPSPVWDDIKSRLNGQAPDMLAGIQGWQIESVPVGTAGMPDSTAHIQAPQISAPSMTEHSNSWVSTSTSHSRWG